MPEQTTDAHPAFTAPPAASGESVVPITAAELQRFRGLEAELERLRPLETQAKDLQAKYAAEISDRDGRLSRALAELDDARKGFDGERSTWQAKLAEADGRVGQIRQRLLDRAKAEVISAGLAGVQFVGDESTRAKVAGAFRDLIGPKFEAREDDAGNVVVVEKATGKPAAEAIPAMLRAPEHLGFFAPTTRGGSGTDGTGSGGMGLHPSGNPHPPGSLEWHAANMARAREMNGNGLMIIDRK